MWTARRGTATGSGWRTISRSSRSVCGEERTLLDGVATQAVIAIENARLVEDLRRSRAQVLRADRLGTLGTLAVRTARCKDLRAAKVLDR